MEILDSFRSDWRKHCAHWPINYQSRLLLYTVFDLWTIKQKETFAFSVTNSRCVLMHIFLIGEKGDFPTSLIILSSIMAPLKTFQFLTKTCSLPRALIFFFYYYSFSPLLLVLLIHS